MTESLRLLYSKYSNTNEIDPEAIECLCSDLGIDIQGFQVLVLAFKLKASNMGVFSRDEFINGCIFMQVDNIDTLKEKVNETLNDQDLKELYIWLHKWAKEDDCRSLDVAVNCILKSNFLFL